MTYNYGYDPNSPYMNPYPQITYPTYRAPNYTPQFQDLIKIQGGVEAARVYPTKPNSRVAMFDADDDIMYIKTTDANNFATVKKFRFYEEVDPEPEDKFVTIDEFNKFKEEMINAQQSIRTDKYDAKSNGSSKSNNK